jgi:hypothetical protein
MIITITAVIVAALIVGFHFGHGHANYRHARASGRKPRLFASLGRGAFIWGSVPVGEGFRLGHKL